MGKFQIGKKQYKGESSQFSKEYVDKKLGEHRSAEPLDHPDGSVTAQKLAEQSVDLSKLAAAVTDYFATAAEVQEHITDTDNPHRVDKTDLGLDQVENTSDLDKPISNETQAALAGKVDKAPGMGLSHNDYTDIEKQRLSDVIHNLYTHRTAAELDHPDRSVTRYKLADDSVVAAKIADGHVINSKLADGAVTLNKLADDVLKKIDVLPTEIGDIQEAVQNGVYLYHGHIACDGTYVIHVQSGELESGGYAVSQTAFCVAVDDVADSAYLGRMFRRSGIWEPGETDLPEEWLQEHEGRMEARDLDACKETGLYDIQFADLTEAERAKFPAEAQGIQSGEFSLLSFCGGAVQFLICETAGEQDGQGQPLADGRMWVRSVYGDEPAAWQRRYDLEAIDNLTSADGLRPLSANQGRVLKSMVDGKVDEEAGKGLSTNDYTDAEKEKLAGIEAGAQVNDVTSVAGKTGAVTLDKADVGLEFVTLAETDGVAVGIETEMTGMGGAIGKRSGAGDGFAGGYTAWTQSGGAIGNGASSAGGGAAGEGAQAGDGFAGGKAAKVTQNIDAIQLGTGTNPTAKTLQVYEYQMMDANGKIPDARMPQLDTKVDKVTGKGLSTNDYTTEEKTKLAGIETGANNYVHPASHPATMITEDTAHRFASDTEKAAWNGKLDAGNIKAGANVSVSVSGNDVTISSTGGGSGSSVGVVDNLESTSTTDALSANQGRVLKGEVDGKAAASHTHTKTQITDFAHTHGKADITDFAHTHTKTDITDFPASMTPTAHASTATTYGVGTATQYGHVKLANNLTTAATGSALDARQGKVLQDSKLEAADIVAGDNVEVDTSGGTVTISASGGGQKGSAVYRETGTWYCPPGVTKVTVIAIGGGGGGGSRNGPDFTKGGGGGGGGNIRLYENVSVTPGTTYDVVVGAGGFGGNSSSQDGKSGGTSYFRSTSYGATGGTGGAVGTSSAIGAGGNGQAGGGGGGTAAANGGNGYTGADGSGALGGDGSGQPISADMIAKTTGGQYALCNGGKSAGHGISSGSVNEEAPNSVGCGGKGALTVTNSQTISGQTGGDGGVYIYYEVE